MGTSIPDRGRVLGPVIPNVLDEEFEEIVKATDPLTLPKVASRSFLAVGSWAPYRNYETLLKAYYLYRAAGGTWELLIGGPGRPRLDATQLDGVRLFDSMSRREVFIAYLRSGVAIFPSSVEASPVAVLEACEAGIPMIVSDIQGHRDLPINASKFPTMDSLALCELMHKQDFVPGAPYDRVVSCASRSLVRREVREAWLTSMAEQLQKVCQ